MPSQSETIFINSSARVSGSIDNGRYQLPQDVISCTESQHVKIKLVYFMTKHSWYNIASTRNSTWTLIEDSTETACSLSDGNYNVRELASAIGTELSAKTAKSETYLCTWDNISGLFTITASGGSATDISLAFNLASETKYIFGFNTDTAVFTTKSLVSDQIVNIGNIKSIFIHTNWAQRYYLTGSTTNARTNLFAVISNLTPNLGEIFYESGTGLSFEQEIPNVQALSNIEFQMLDSFGNALELTSDWIMALEITKSDAVHIQKMRDYLMLTR